MFYNRTKNNKINRIHERCLRLIYNDKNPLLRVSYIKISIISIHHQNLRSLAIEMHKVHRGISPELLNDLFLLREADLYNLRNRSQFIIPNVKTENHGFQSLRYHMGDYTITLKKK